MAGALRHPVRTMKGYLFTYALVALGVVGAFRTPLITLAVYIAFAILRPHAMWGFAGSLHGISRIVGIALLVSWAAKGLGTWKFGRATSVVGALLFFAIWSTISATMAVNGPVAWAVVEETWKFVLPVMVGVTMIRTERWTRAMLWLIVVTQGYVAYELNYAYMIDGFNRVHLYGFGGMDNNSMGIALVTTLGPAIALVLGSTTWRARAVAIAASLFILHATLLTYSRGAMLGLLTMAVAAVVIIPKRPRQIAFMAVAFAIALRLTGPELMARYETAFSEETERDYSAGSRIQLWSDCLTVALNNPFFGVGPNNWPQVASTFGWPHLKSAHSVWMQGLAELGFPGLFALAAFYILAFIKLWPMARTRSTAAVDRERAAIATGIMLGIAGFAVSGQFVSLIGLEVPYYLVMVGAALLYTSSSQAVTATEAVPSDTAARVPQIAASPVPIAVSHQGLAPQSSRPMLTRRLREYGKGQPLERG